MVIIKSTILGSILLSQYLYVSSYSHTHAGANHFGRLIESKKNYADSAVASLADVDHKQVLSGLNTLYPPDDLNSRNSKSRTDGYWSFISTGKEPPIHLTYGEFDFEFFADLLDRANYHYTKFDKSNKHVESRGWNDKTFLDIGSGTGRLVIGAAALHPEWALCRGIEILPGIHETAVESLEKCFRGSTSNIDRTQKIPSSSTPPSVSYTNEEWQKLSMGIPIIKASQNMLTERASNLYSLSCPSTNTNSEDIETHLPLPPIEFSCGSFEDPKENIGTADLIFVFSTCWTEELMFSLSECIRRECKPGTIAITTEFPLPLSCENAGGVTCDLDLVEKVDGLCSVTGGISTAYIHRVM